jgi:hypothetical protein
MQESSVTIVFIPFAILKYNNNNNKKKYYETNAKFVYFCVSLSAFAIKIKTR